MYKKINNLFKNNLTRKKKFHINIYQHNAQPLHYLGYQTHLFGTTV